MKVQMQQMTVKKEQKNKKTWDKKKTNSKMADTNQPISIIILNVNDLKVNGRKNRKEYKEYVGQSDKKLKNT